MNNKGFAITGIIYTLFILFLMILLSVLSGLRSYQRLMISSTSSLETSFEGTKLSELSLDVIDDENVTKYAGKYVFTEGTNTCTTYLASDVDLDIDTIHFTEGTCSFSPNESNLKTDETYIFGVES